MSKSKEIKKLNVRIGKLSEEIIGLVPDEKKELALKIYMDAFLTIQRATIITIMEQKIKN